MRKIILTMLLLCTAALSAGAQTPFSYYVERRIPINWKPETKDYQRYTVGINPFYIANNGMKFDFEYELRKPGEWIQTSLMVYGAPTRSENSWRGAEYETFNSGFDYYDNMWGLGVSAMFKKMFHSRGWYFSTGVSLEFYRVGYNEYGFVPFTEDGHTFYYYGSSARKNSYVKPTAHLNIGKHMAVSGRCFFDLYVGVSYSYSIYDRDKEIIHDGYYHDSYYYDDYLYTGMWGFARRGFNVNGGFRFGVLLWKR